MIDINKIYFMDCMDGLRLLPNNFVDCVITDPPYGINYQSSRRIDKEERFKIIENDKTPFIWFLYDSFRVLKEGGCLICFCRWDVQNQFYNAIIWAGFEVKSQVIWDREVHGLGDLKSQFSPRHDVLWFATKGNFEFKNGRPASVLKYQRVAAEKLRHPNEKPEELMRYLVKKLSNEGDLVLDPFMGSGSTAVACKQTGRNFVGFEIDNAYYEISLNRLNQKGLFQSISGE